MITTEMVYWIIMLDKISSAFIIFAVAFGLILFLMTGAILSNEVECPWHYPVWIVLELFFICGAVFLPNTKQMATIYVVPAIVNNERVQNIGNKTLDVSEDLLKLTEQYLKNVSTDKR